MLMYDRDLLGRYSNRAVRRSIRKYARESRLGPTSHGKPAATRPQTSAFLQQSVPFDQITVFAIGGAPILSRWAANRVTTQQAICRVFGFFVRLAKENRYASYKTNHHHISLGASSCHP